MNHEFLLNIKQNNLVISKPIQQLLDMSKRKPIRQPIVQEPIKQEPIKQKPIKQKLIKYKPIKYKPIEYKIIEQESIQQESIQQESIQQEPIQQESIQQEPIQQEPIQQESIEQEPIQQESIQQEPIQQESIEQESIQQESIQQESIQQESIQQESIQQESIEQESIEQESIQQESIQQEPIQQEPIQEQIVMPKQKRKVYIISNISGGGSKKYLDNIIQNYYTNVHFIIIRCMDDFNKHIFKPTDIIFLQHIIFTDINPSDILKIIYNTKVKLIITIHDFVWFTNSNNNNLSENDVEPYFENIYIKDNIIIDPDIITLLNIANLVIHPSKFTIKHYSKYFSTKNNILYKHNDINIQDNKIIPIINNNKINIASFHKLSKYKGEENIILLKNKYKNYKGYTINFLTDIQYNEKNWYIKMKQNNIHGLLHLNKYGETYSYALTKSLSSGLPILYNNIGAYKERISKKKGTHYMKVIDNEINYNNEYKLFINFEFWLDYIIKNNGLNTSNEYEKKNDYDVLKKKYNEYTMIKYNELYDFLFSDVYKKDILSKIHKKVKPFAIYFPQFHKIKENDINFYNGMTDIKNLYELNKTLYYYKLDTPSLTELGLKSILDYDLTNEKIIQQQVSIAKNYGIYGFAIYYYWFSHNTITNKNTIMDECYDLFFKNTLDGFKIFFIWANEDWTKNEAFGNMNIGVKIVNIYEKINYDKNIDNLIRYFKHDNYYKIDNKPLFYIHHPFDISDENLILFKELLNKKCIENGFDGINLYLNNMSKTYDNFNNYNFHPNYKKNIEINYKKYVKLSLDSNSNCIFFDFNNSARMFKPYKPKLITAYNNNNIYNQDDFVNKVLQNYKGKDVNNDILLINSWNEWGENMAIEPGNINHYKYLSLIKNNLLSFCADDNIVK